MIETKRMTYISLSGGIEAVPVMRWVGERIQVAVALPHFEEGEE